jgi:hypothetical protein
MRTHRAFLVAVIAVSAGMAGESPRRADVQKLIEELDHPVYSIRLAAEQTLAGMGESAVPALKQALKPPVSLEMERRLTRLLSRYEPLSYDVHFNGWHWVYSTIVHAQTFEATGTTVETLRLRVAQLNANRPAAPLEVEIRDAKLETIYLRGMIDPGILQREFAWQRVALLHVAPLKPKEKYVLVFHSQGSKNTGPWAVNAIYQDVYPGGHHWYTRTEDFFFAIEYADGRGLRVGPRSDDTAFKTPINSGAGGGAVGQGTLQLQSYGPIPQGKLSEGVKRVKQ